MSANHFSTNFYCKSPNGFPYELLVLQIYVQTDFLITSSGIVLVKFLTMNRGLLLVEIANAPQWPNALFLVASRVFESDTNMSLRLWSSVKDRMRFKLLFSLSILAFQVREIEGLFR